eukprot:3982585-Karenia_brevis.AAC.1
MAEKCGHLEARGIRSRAKVDLEDKSPAQVVVELREKPPTLQWKYEFAAKHKVPREEITLLFDERVCGEAVEEEMWRP